MAKGAVTIDVSSDSRRLQADMRKAGDSVKGLEGRVEKLGKALAFGVGAKAIVDFGAAAVKAAMDDAAAQSTLARAIRNATGARDSEVASVEAWITKTSHATGVLDDELRPALASLVTATRDTAQAQDLMATAMDVARGKGVPLQTVADALAKAYAGNTTALGRLVPGIRQAGESTLSFAVAKDRLNQMFNGQAAAWAETDAGKMARINAQWSDMQETLGSALIPALSQVAGVVSSVLNWFNGLDESTQSTIVTIGVVAGVVVAAASAFGALSSALEAVGVSSAMAGPVMAGLVVAVGAVVAAIEIFGEEETAASKLARELNGTLHSGASAFDANKVAALSAADAVTQFGDAATAGIDKKLSDAILTNESMVGGLNALRLSIADVIAANHGDAESQDRVIAARRAAVEAGLVQARTLHGAYAAQEELTAATEAWIATGERATSTALGASIVWEDQGSSVLDLTEEMRTQSQAYAENIALTKEQALAGDKTAAAWLKATGNLGGLTAEQRRNVDAVLEQSDALETISDTSATTTNRFEELASAASSLRQAFAAITGPGMELEDTQRALIDGADRLAKSLQENGQSLDINTAAGRANREVIQSQVEHILSLTAAMVRNGASMDEASAAASSMTAQLIQQSGTTDQARSAASAYIAQLGLTPDNIRTAIELAGADAAIARANGVKLAVDRIPSLKTVKVAITTSGSLPSGLSKSKSGTTASAYAAGTITSGPEFALIGESGQEAVLPLTDRGRMSELVNDSRVRGPVLQALGARQGGGVTINMTTGNVYGVDDLTAAIGEAFRRVERRQLAGSRV